MNTLSSNPDIESFKQIDWKDTDDDWMKDLSNLLDDKTEKYPITGCSPEAYYGSHAATLALELNNAIRVLRKLCYYDQVMPDLIQAREDGTMLIEQHITAQKANK
jgi:hypothetical protein